VFYIFFVFSGTIWFIRLLQYSFTIKYFTMSVRNKLTHKDFGVGLFLLLQALDQEWFLPPSSLPLHLVLPWCSRPRSSRSISTDEEWRLTWRHPNRFFHRKSCFYIIEEYQFCQLFHKSVWFYTTFYGIGSYVCNLAARIRVNDSTCTQCEDLHAVMWLPDLAKWDKTN